MAGYEMGAHISRRAQGALEIVNMRRSVARYDFWARLSRKCHYRLGAAMAAGTAWLGDTDMMTRHEFGRCRLVDDDDVIYHICRHVIDCGGRDYIMRNIIAALVSAWAS